jgi:thymidine kinase
MVIRLDENGNAITQGSQVEIGGNDRYVSMCRKHFKENYFRQTLMPQHQLPLSVTGRGDD